MDDIVDLLRIKIEKAKTELPEDTLNAINAVDWRTTILQMREKKGYSFEQLGDLELETELLLSGLVSGKDYPKELETRMKISKLAASELVNEMNEKVFSKIKEELIKSTERKKIFEKNPPVVSSRGENRGGFINSSLIADKKKNDAQVLDSAGIKIVENKEAMPTLDKLELTEPVSNVLISDMSAEKPVEKAAEVQTPKEVTAQASQAEPSADTGEAHSILAQKLNGAFQIPSKKTEYSLNNLSKAGSADDTSPMQESETPKTVPTSYPLKSDPYRMPPE
jgi:predicted ribosome-associated RNA-binding protein Tma20